jgi:hypothetical protein
MAAADLNLPAFARFDAKEAALGVGSLELWLVFRVHGDQCEAFAHFRLLADPLVGVATLPGIDDPSDLAQPPPRNAGCAPARWPR